MRLTKPQFETTKLASRHTCRPSAMQNCQPPARTQAQTHTHTHTNLYTYTYTPLRQNLQLFEPDDASSCRNRASLHSGTIQRHARRPSGSGSGRGSRPLEPKGICTAGVNHVYGNQEFACMYICVCILHRYTQYIHEVFLCRACIICRYHMGSRNSSTLRWQLGF